MTDCMNQDVRDALPDLLHGRLDELNTATMLAHVESCAECTAELALLREARASARVAPSIDVDKIVAALPLSGMADAAIAQAPVAKANRGVSSQLWKFAAAAVIAVSGLAVLNQRDNVSAPMRVAQDTQIVAPVSGTPLSLVAGVQDLTDEQIQTLLTELDEIDPIPSAEPEPSLPSVDELAVSEQGAGE